MDENKRNVNSRSQIPTAPTLPLRPGPNLYNNLNSSTHSRHFSTGMNLNDNVIFTSNLSPRSSFLSEKIIPGGGGSIIPLQAPPALPEAALPIRKSQPSLSGYSGGGIGGGIGGVLSGGGGGGGSKGSKLSNNKKASVKPSKKKQNAIAQFAPSTLYPNIYGCINCEPHLNGMNDLDNDNKIVHSTMSSSNLTTTVAMEQPILLEIRLLERIRDHTHGNYYSRSRLLAISQGTPDTAGIYSTCMAFRPSTSTSTSISTSTLADKQLMASNLAESNLDTKDDSFFVATGLSNGALCLHTISNVNDIISSPLSSPKSSILNYYYSNRPHRPATCVAWAPSSPSQRSSNLVAIGLQSNTYTTNKRSNRGSDREACCLVWDIEHHVQSGTATSLAGISSISSGNSTISGTMGGFGNTTNAILPSGKYVHHSGVSSIAWLPHLTSISGPGKTLLVGCQSRQIQLYDLRVTGSSSHSQPISFIAHSDAVSGIQVDPNRPYLFASFCSTDHSPINYSNTSSSSSSTNVKNAILPNETFSPIDPIKLWDIRKLEKEKPVGEIKLLQDKSGTVHDIAWNTQSTGTLVVAMGNTIRYFDTLTSITRPILTQMSHCDEPIGSIAFPFPSKMKKNTSSIHLPKNTSSNMDGSLLSSSVDHNDMIPARMLAVSKRGKMNDLATFQLAPLSISSRDGRIAHTLGKLLWIGNTTDGK